VYETGVETENLLQTDMGFICMLPAGDSNKRRRGLGAGLELTFLLQLAAMCAGTPLRCLGLWH